MTVFIPDLSDEDSQAEIEKIEGLVTTSGGTITETLTTSPWGRRRLAYTIRFNGVDYRDGIYTVFHFDMAPSALAEMEREMKLDTTLMRYLLVHDDPKAGERVDETEAGEEGATEGEPTAGEAAGGATAAAATAATSETEPAEAAVGSPETPAAEAPAAAQETAPEAAQEAPVEEAAAPTTVTDTAPEPADEAEAGETTEKE
jgi:small subunit ribosomal protein S6